MLHGVLGRLRLALVLDIGQGDDRAAVDLGYILIHTDGAELVAGVGLLVQRILHDGDLGGIVVDPSSTSVLLGILDLLHTTNHVLHRVAGGLRLSLILDVVHLQHILRGGVGSNVGCQGEGAAAIFVVAVRAMELIAYDRLVGVTACGNAHRLADPALLGVHRDSIAILHRLVQLVSGLRNVVLDLRADAVLRALVLDVVQLQHQAAVARDHAAGHSAVYRRVQLVARISLHNTRCCCRYRCAGSAVLILSISQNVLVTGLQVILYNIHCCVAGYPLSIQSGVSAYLNSIACSIVRATAVGLGIPPGEGVASLG